MNILPEKVLELEHYKHNNKYICFKYLWHFIALIMCWFKDAKSMISGFLINEKLLTIYLYYS